MLKGEKVYLDKRRKAASKREAKSIVEGIIRGDLVFSGGKKRTVQS